MSHLRRFWFTFRCGEMPSPHGRYWGLTAYDLNDALGILGKQLFCGGSLPAPLYCIEDVDVSTLDPKHVLPNIGSVVVRGVWFPRIQEAATDNHE